MVLSSIAIHPCSRWGWGPITQNFLNSTTGNLKYILPDNKPNAKTMFSLATSHPCPIGIFKTKDATQKSHKTQNFFGYSYTASTPSIYTIQQLGLSITKPFSNYIQNTTNAVYTTVLQTRQSNKYSDRGLD